MISPVDLSGMIAPELNMETIYDNLQKMACFEKPQSGPSLVSSQPIELPAS